MFRKRADATVVLLAATLLMAQTGLAIGQTTTQERIIGHIEIRGNRLVPTDEIRNCIKSKVGERYDEHVARDDFERILRLDGIDALGCSLTIKNGVRNEMEIIFLIKENPRPN